VTAQSQAKRLRIGALFGALALLSACQAPRAVFDLADARPAPRERRAILAVNEPTAPALAAGERIVLRGAAGDLYLLAGAQWSDRATRLAQRRLIAAIDATGLSAALPGAPAAAALNLDLRRFEIDAARETAIVELVATLADDRTGKTLATTPFLAEAPAAGVDGRNATLALGAALDRAGAQIARWARARLAAARD
jgi:cholesterol transport system auxiliary component